MVTYLLFVKLNKTLKLKVGSLGEIVFDKGLYVYVGSAKKSIKRVTRHFKKNKKVHWHIDYLTTNEYCHVLFSYIIKKDEESKLANYLYTHYPAIPHFGSTDTKDFSHLFKIG